LDVGGTSNSALFMENMGPSMVDTAVSNSIANLKARNWTVWTDPID
jgi:hypothetical protein